MIKIGQRLREQRLQQGLSLEDVTRETKIRPAFLSAIERGEYHKLPASAYAQGFVINYADFLGLSRREALALFRREFDISGSLAVLPDRFANPADTSLARFKIQHTSLIILLLFLSFLGYMAYSYKDAVTNPPLSVKTIKQATTSTGEILVEGKTHPYATVTVNNLPVSIHDDGTFRKVLTSFMGKVPIVIKATNRFGKTSVIEKTIEVKQNISY